MLWACLLPPSDPPPGSHDDRLQGIAVWGLQYTPKVALLRGSVVLEVAASARLFGGRRALRRSIESGAAELDAAVAWAPNALASLVLVRSGVAEAITRPLAQVLDLLPLTALDALAAHATTLTRIGCRTLADVRALPRGGVTRRFGADALADLDVAYGLRAEAHVWVELPATFRSRLELMARVETAPALLFGARRPLLQLGGWLAARPAGTTAFVLRWAHDTMRARDAGDGGELVVRTARAMRDVEHLCRLLAEQLARVTLRAPAGEIELEALVVQPLEEASATFLHDVVDDAERLALTLERITARLGPARVLDAQLVEDYRLEWTQHWQPTGAPRPSRRARGARFPQPSFLLAEPLRLAVRRVGSTEGPIYQGPLELLVGPHRVEGGWWDRVATLLEATPSARTVIEPAPVNRHVVRDYWVARSEHAGVLWIFQQRLTGDDASAWFLQGSFA